MAGYTENQQIPSYLSRGALYWINEPGHCIKRVKEETLWIQCCELG